MSHVIMFLASLVCELLGAGYTVALTRGNKGVAILCTLLMPIFTYGVLLQVIDDHQLIPASILGEVVATVVILQVTSRRNK